MGQNAPKIHEYYPECPEALIVNLARSGDRDAFGELVKRHQSSIRQLLRRCCGDAVLADDLSQQTFFRAWLKIRLLRSAPAFNTWLRRLAVSIWLQSSRKADALRHAAPLEDRQGSGEGAGLEKDLDHALRALTDDMRLCVVLSYHEGLSHSEIAELTELPMGTIKSNIRRGALKLRETLRAYDDTRGDSP
jgi:RNA polymerase sigma-70 factor (ECF subfamily)